jgi:hypothetical protein
MEGWSCPATRVPREAWPAAGELVDFLKEEAWALDLQVEGGTEVEGKACWQGVQLCRVPQEPLPSLWAVLSCPPRPRWLGPEDLLPSLSLGF